MNEITITSLHKVLISSQLKKKIYWHPIIAKAYNHSKIIRGQCHLTEYGKWNAHQHSTKALISHLLILHMLIRSKKEKNHLIKNIPKFLILVHCHLLNTQNMSQTSTPQSYTFLKKSNKLQCQNLIFTIYSQLILISIVNP